MQCLQRPGLARGWHSGVVERCGPWAPVVPRIVLGPSAAHRSARVTGAAGVNGRASGDKGANSADSSSSPGMRKLDATVQDADTAVLNDVQGASSSSNQGESREGSVPPEQERPLLLRLLARWPVTAWILRLVAAVQQRDGNALRVLRVMGIGILFVMVAVTRQLFDSRTQPRTAEVMYSDFVTLLDRGRVRSVRLESGTGRLYFDVTPRPAAAAAPEATTPAASPSGAQAAVRAQHDTAPSASITAGAGMAVAAAASSSSTPAPAAAVQPVRFQRQFMVKLADKQDLLLTSKILTAGVEFAVTQKALGAVLANMLVTTLAVWIPLFPLFFLLRRIMEDRTTTKKKKTDNKPQQPSITFRDVAGVESAKEELMEVVTVMKASKAAYNKLNVKMPSGVLLCGPPGTGKTLLAKAVAGEAGVPFFAFSASEFVELYVGRGAARIREVFTEARRAAPCVVFIDELDAVGARRGMGYNDERDQTLNQLLTELDGFEGRPGILFLAATNRIEILDPALLRPGRINRKINVPLPDEAGRRDILAVHLRRTPMATREEKEEACERLAKVTQGFSGAELANVVNEGTLLAARADSDVVSMRHLLEGASRTKNGVNGSGQLGWLAGFQKMLLDVAGSSDVDSRRVKNATAS